MWLLLGHPPKKFTVPPRRSIFTAISQATGRPTASIAMSTPRPPVSSRTCCTAREPFSESTPSSAPMRMARSSCPGRRPSAITRAPCSLASFTNMVPMGPSPITVAVVGLGPIGTMFVKLAKLQGARVIALGRRPGQLERAIRMGADEGVLSEKGSRAVQQVRELTGGRGVDIAIEAVGLPVAWEMAVKMLRRGGTVNFFGGCPSNSSISLDTSLLHYSEITCKASFHHTPGHIRRSLEIVSRGEIAARDFVNREEPLANLLEVMRHLMSHNGHLKTAILP